MDSTQDIIRQLYNNKKAPSRPTEEDRNDPMDQDDTSPAEEKRQHSYDIDMDDSSGGCKPKQQDTDDEEEHLVRCICADNEVSFLFLEWLECSDLKKGE